MWLIKFILFLELKDLRLIFIYCHMKFNKPKNEFYSLYGKLLILFIAEIYKNSKNRNEY